MPRYSKEVERTYTERIRSIIVFHPKSSLKDIKRMLSESKKEPVDLAIPYIMKLRNRIYGEQANRYNRATVEKELARFEDLITELTKQLLVVMTDKDALNKDRVAAIREIRTEFRDLFEKKFDAGIFKRSIGEATIDATISSIIKEVNKTAGTKFKWQEPHGKGGRPKVDVSIKPADIISEEDDSE